MAPGPDSLEAARAARLHSRDVFIEAVEQGRTVRDVTSKVRREVRLNHFTEDLDAIWRNP